MGLLQTPSSYPGLSRRVLNIQHLAQALRCLPVGLHLCGAPRNPLRYAPTALPTQHRLARGLLLAAS